MEWFNKLDTKKKIMAGAVAAIVVLALLSAFGVLAPPA